jgi:acyl-CoA reductase-like NAD-dependent aldehyde dehydrogenase
VTFSHVVNPATEEILAEVECHDQHAVSAATTRAIAAQEQWARLTPDERCRLLRRFASNMAERGEELALAECRNVGKVIEDARADAAMAIDTVEYFAELARRRSGRVAPVDRGVSMTFHDPLGVSALIVPWNFPLAITSWKLAPALAAGNSAVIKPSELTPLSALLLQEIARDSDLPPFLVQVLTGPGRHVGEALLRDPAVAKVSFTGSTEVGKAVASAAASSLKRVSLELGGKSANIVFGDADLEQAAYEAPMAAFLNAGQNCCARGRILVERTVADRFTEMFIERANSLRVGDPLDPGSDVGPVITRQRQAAIDGFLGPDEVLWRGDVPQGSGYWSAPTLVGPVSNSSRIATEEVFGPVAALVLFDDEAEAIRLANESEYGLSGSIWTSSGARALRVAGAVKSGVLSVNSHDSVRVGWPFGGYKMSGYGRELGPEALDAYSEVKSVFVAT